MKRGFSGVTKNFSVLIIGQTIYKVCSFVIMMIIARFLGPEDFGRFSYGLSFVWIFLFLADFGLTDLFIRDVAANKALLEKYANNIFALKIIMGVVSYLVIFLMGFSLSSDPIKFIIILILGASVIMDSFSCFLRSIFSIAERMEYQAFLMVIEAFIELGLFIFVLFHSMSLTKVILVAVILLISSSLNNVINFHFFLKFYKKIRLEWDFAFWKKKLLAGFPFMLIYILGLINLKVDIIIVSRMLGDRAAGLINSDFKLLEQFFIVPSILSFVLLPVFSRLSVSLVKIQKLLRTFLPLMIIAGILAVVFCHIFGRTAINIVYGAEFSEAFSYFGIASWLLLPFFVKPIFEKLLFGLGREMSLCVLYFFGAVLNAVLAIILTARFGINGVLIATLTCEVLLVIICTYSYKRIYKNSLKYDGDSILVNGSLSQ